VGAVGVPVNAGLAKGALEVSVGCTWSARATVDKAPTETEPFIRILAVFDSKGKVAELIAEFTNAVVANFNELSAREIAVLLAGSPVKVGLANGALVVSVGCRWSARAIVEVVPTLTAPFIRMLEVFVSNTREPEIPAAISV
jgi:hypothetical protein